MIYLKIITCFLEMFRNLQQFLFFSKFFLYSFLNLKTLKISENQDGRFIACATKRVFGVIIWSNNVVGK